MGSQEDKEHTQEYRSCMIIYFGLLCVQDYKYSHIYYIYCAHVHQGVFRPKFIMWPRRGWPHIFLLASVWKMLNMELQNELP